MAFVNVMRAMSVDCDCDCAGAGADAPEVPDVGILASTDLLAVEQATIDMLYSMPEDVRRPLQERIESRKGLRQLSAMKELGLGTGEYELISV